MLRQATAYLRSSQGAALIFTIACLVLASAVWIESDAYRYVAGLLIVAGLVDYLQTPRGSRVGIGWLGLACFGWAAYVAARYGWALTMDPQGSKGSAEGLYLFPVAFTTMGYAFYRFRAHMTRLPDAFMLVSLAMLATTIDFPSVFAGDRTPFLHQNNTIHASVAAGFIAIAALAYAEQAYRQLSSRTAEPALVRIALGLLVVMLCLLAIYGAKSKGVWLALAGALPLQLAIALLGLPRRRVLAAAVLGGTAMLVVALAALGGVLRELSAPTLSAMALVDTAVLHDHGVSAVNDLIRSGTVPFSFQERLMLWMNALEVLRDHPLFGAGIGWRDAWEKTAYAEVPYHLMHNGYIEVAVRYGLTGLAFFAALYAAFAICVLRAWRRRLVSPMAAKVWIFSSAFFALTLLTNSNNRLAIGESFILISAGFAFCCLYLGQHAASRAIR